MELTNWIQLFARFASFPCSFCLLLRVLLGLLHCHCKSLKLSLLWFQAYRFLLNLLSELFLKSFKLCDWFLNMRQTILDIFLCFGKILLGKNRTNQFVNICIIVKKFEFFHNHVVFALLLNHRLLVNDNLFVFWYEDKLGDLKNTYQPRCAWFQPSLSPCLAAASELPPF